MKYEYKSKINGEKIILDRRLTEAEMDEQQVKRVYSFGIAWPMSERGH